MRRSSKTSTSSAQLISNKVHVLAETQVALLEKEKASGVYLKRISHKAIEGFFNGKMPAISFFSRMRRQSRKVRRQIKREKKMGKANELRQQVIFRLWPEDHDELRAYLDEKGITLQLFAETVTRAFIAGDPLLERLVEREQNRRIRARKKKLRYSVDGLMDGIYEDVGEDEDEEEEDA